jgi:hypothetical protein
MRLKLYHVVPGGLKLPTALSHDGLVEFNPIRETYQVQISGEQQNSIIRISGKSVAQLKVAMYGICGIIQGLRTKEASARQVLQVQPPRLGMGGGIISFRVGGSRPVWSTKGHPESCGVEATALSDYKKQFAKILARGISSLQPEQSEMKMRAKFGHVLVTPAHIDQAAEYTHAEFVDFATRVAARQAVKLETSIGSDAFPWLMAKTAAPHIRHFLTLRSHDVTVEGEIQHGDENPKADLVTPAAFGRDQKRLEITSAAPDRYVSYVSTAAASGLLTEGRT